MGSTALAVSTWGHAPPVDARALRLSHLGYVVHSNRRRHDGPKVGEGGKGDGKALGEPGGEAFRAIC